MFLFPLFGCLLLFLLLVLLDFSHTAVISYYGSACGAVLAINLNQRVVQDAGKAYNELKQGEPAIQRLFGLTSFESEVNTF